MHDAPIKEEIITNRRAMRSGKVVAFVGVDGAGKSSIVNRIYESLKLRGIAVDRVWCGFSNWTFMNRPIKGMREKISPRGNENERVVSEPLHNPIDRILDNSFVRLLYYCAVSVEHVLQLTMKVSFPRTNGNVILCDRYYIDQSVSNSVELDSVRMERIFLRFYSILLPAPDIVFIVLVPPRISIARKNDIPSLEYVSKRYQRYQHLEKGSRYVMLDGTRPLEENVAEALERIAGIINT